MKTGAPSTARRLARQALAFAPQPLPEAVARKAKICLLDYLCCVFESRDLETSRQAVAVTRPAGRGAQVIGTNILAHPADAAFANATTGHGLVREDMHVPSIGHHGVVVWPALLALAQREPVRGARFLAAAVIGYEAAARIGTALFDAEIARLFRPTGLASPIGAALGGAYMVGLDEDGCTRALSLAVNTASGLNQWPHSGGGEMYFHPGFAARNAVTAVELAEVGAHASEDVIEGEAGLIAAFRRKPARAEIALFAGDRPEILAVFNKPAPACNYAQTPCQAALQVARELGAQRREIQSVSVRASDAALRYPGCNFKGPFERPLQAKMSIQFGVAAALANAALEEANYRIPESAEIRRLVAATSLAADAEFTSAYPARQSAEVEVVLNDGSRMARQLDDVVPATEIEVRERFRRAAVAVVGDDTAREMERLVDGLEQASDAGRVAALCRTSAARPERRERVAP
ncbi:MAG TPA: MmgE/PrpD family protein [Alphaproteobacteria bacterium]|nr:MmgE/PrpD family protein [Alphaproteobacteria bacterium]